MAVLSGATASAKQLYQGELGTSNATIYTSPAQSTNVTAPSATAYIKEIIITNITGNPITVSINVGGTTNANYIISSVTVNADDVKILSGLNTMIPASTAIGAWSNTASACNLYISGVEVQ